MPKASAPYKEGAAWCLRWRGKGEDLFVSGRSSPKAARDEMDRLKAAYSGHFKPKGLGPAETTLGQALLEFGEETFPFLKGAQQECRRINRYLRAVNLPTLEAVKLTEEDLAKLEPAAKQSVQVCGAGDGTATPQGNLPKSTDTAIKNRKHDDKSTCWRINRVPAEPGGQRKFPKGLKGHREAQARKSAGSDLTHDVDSTMRRSG